MRRFLLLLALTLVLCVADETSRLSDPSAIAFNIADIQPSVDRDEKSIVFLDFRTYSDLAVRSLQPDLRIDERELVLSEILRTANLNGLCSSAQLSPEIVDAVRGSFSIPGSIQSAYLISLGDSCGQRGQSRHLLGIYEHTSLVAFSNVTGYSSIFKTSDLDLNGLDELTLIRNFVGTGGTEASVILLDVEKDELRILQSFRAVYGNNFSGIGDRKRASVVSVIPDERRIHFIRDNYQAMCSRNRENNIAISQQFECDDYEIIDSEESM